MRCPSCRGKVISPEGQNGEKVCSACGLVLSKTPIAREQSFTQWNPEWHSNWHQNDSETLKEWLTTLRTVSCQLNLPSFPYREEAARRIREENHILFHSQKFGKNKRATVAALLHLILRQYDKNRPIKDICKQLSLDSRLVIKQSWALNKTVIDNQRSFINIPRKTSTDYLFEYGGKITNDTQLLIQAEEILTKIRSTGGNPIALASGSFYHVCKNEKVKVSKEQIGEAFKISHRTVYTNEAKIRTLLQRAGIQKTQTASTPKLPLLIVARRKK
jgi:transcription initiation factor TFIIIB Brf1 subunit/transcription initiation factor TFIIB